MNRRGVLGALSAVAISGCLRLTSSAGTETAGEAGSESPTETVAETATATQTTAEPETTTGRVGELELPDGLSEDGPESFLYAFHRQALQRSSFRVNWTKINANRSFIKWQKEFDVDAGTSSGSFTRGDSGNSVDIYRSGNDGLWREDMGAHYTYGNDDDGFNVDEVTWEQELEPMLTAGDWRAPTLVNEEYPAVWELETDTVADESAIPGYHRGTIESIDATIQVDENSVIRSVDAATTIVDRDGETIQYMSEFGIDSFGSVSVTEPDWLATAEQNLPVVSTSLTDDERFVKLRIESGSRFEANSRIIVFADGQEIGSAVGLDEPLDLGVDAYLYKADDWEQSRDIRVARGGRPSVTPTPFDGPLRLAAARETTTYLDGVAVE
ncbi:hypothetical protein [Haloarchaeobius sp. DFWS5]|uniref:hypothetical protein n=1 Tax=Haloarchaeobius sp. DFWS5 TaxID=3446114 RepID=UPI003EBDEE12